MQSFRTIAASLLAGSIAATAILSLPVRVSAQSYPNGYYGLANISYLGGPTTIVRGDSNTQVAATINATVAPGDYVATGSGAAELQFDGSSMLRLASNTQVRLVDMAPGSREVQVAYGTVALAILSGQSGGAQIDTPSVTVRSDQTGDYRVSVLSNGETLVTVRRGSATVSSSNFTQDLTPGATVVSNGNYASLQSPVGFDSFDQFNSERDRDVVASYNSNPYLSPQLAGYSNLANYGRWHDVPGYGYAWAPNNQFQSNFAPYQNGQWVWEPGYGYTWVDNSPYGYTTSHYGTWFNNPNYGGWLWQPPAAQYQDSSADLVSAFLPAVVAFFFTGGSNNYGNGDIGWIPLAPGEQYQPWYGRNYTYPTTTYSTVTNVTNIYNDYTNVRYYRGVTMVPVSSWRNGHFANPIVPRSGQIQRIALIRGAVPVVPTSSNLHYRTTVPHQVVLARAFTAPRLATRALNTSHFAFEKQRERIATIASAHPHEVTFHPAPAKITPTVYHPAPHESIHVAPLAPVRSTVKTTTVHPEAKPVVHPEAKPVVHPEAKPAVHPEAKPAVHPEAKPMAQPEAKPVVHPETKPVVQPETKPVVHPETNSVVHPQATPVLHTQATPVPHPVTHTTPQVVHPASPIPSEHQPAPIAHPAAPIPHPAVPVPHTAAPVERPATRPVTPTAHPTTQAKPEAHPSRSPSPPIIKS